MARYPFIEVEQPRNKFILTAVPASHLVQIAYAAVRHRDDEPGAVQRVLNQSRIAGIKSFILQGGDLPASIVLNWVGPDLLNREGSEVEIPEIPHSAQIIDGQHRVAGLYAAIEDDPDTGSKLIPVAIYEALDTIQCANIFLSINTEQRPAPRSLVFDLYGIASQDLVDKAAVRARDIALALNDDGQAYYGLIKLPNTPRQKGGINLSTAVSAIKPLVDEKGTMELVGVDTLERQIAVFQTFFRVLSDKYGERWNELDNAFLYAAGFMGAVEFLHLKLIPYLAVQGSFKAETMAACLDLDKADLIKQEEVKGIGGKDAPKKIVDRLSSAFKPAVKPAITFDT